MHVLKRARHVSGGRLVEDTAWHPVMAEEVSEWGDSPKGKIFKFFLGTPLKLWASVGHWALWHFDISKFTQRQRARVRLDSLSLCMLHTVASRHWRALQRASFNLVYNNTRRSEVGLSSVSQEIHVHALFSGYFPAARCRHATLERALDAPQVYVSWAACAAFAFGVLPAVVAATGWAGLAKYWLMPWLGVRCQIF